MDLQNAFYIIGIAFMGIMLIILLLLITSVFVIRAKIVSIHKTIEEKLQLVSDVKSAGASVFKTIQKVAHRDK